LAAAAGFLALGAFRLTVGYRRYLRFPHAAWVVIASQAIVMMVAMIAVLGLDWWTRIVMW
jgi:hypothetical protein